MWGKFKTFFLSNLDIAAIAPRPKLPECPKLPQMTVADFGRSKEMGDLGEYIKKGEFVIKILFQIMLN